MDSGGWKIYSVHASTSFFFIPDRVADLIDPISRTWNLELINETLWPVDRGHILSIPIGANDVEDTLVWHFSKDGMFSVKSCYKFYSLSLPYSSG